MDEMNNNITQEVQEVRQPQQPEKPKRRALIMGIIGVVTSFFVFGIIFGIIGLIFGVIDRKKTAKRGIVTAGLSLSIIAIVIAIIAIVGSVLLSFGTASNEDVSSPDTVVEEQADEPEADYEENALVEDGTIAFRGVPWYTTKVEAEKLLKKEGAYEAGWMSDENTIMRMSATDSPGIWFGGETIENGGYEGWYGGLKVAGYEPSDIYACYMYTVDDSGLINKNDDEAQLYIAWYIFSGNDYADIPGLKDDLAQKLTDVYGEGEEENSDYSDDTYWEDESGNILRMHLDSDSTYIVITYMAADADERLDQLQAAMDQESANSEAQIREENADNTEGL